MGNGVPKRRISSTARRIAVSSPTRLRAQSRRSNSARYTNPLARLAPVVSVPAAVNPNR